MPLLVPAAAAWLAGLLAGGWWENPSPAALLALAALAALLGAHAWTGALPSRSPGWRARRPPAPPARRAAPVGSRGGDGPRVLAAVAAVACAGTALAALRADANRRCAAALATGRTVVVALDTRLAPGTVARGQARGAGALGACRQPAVVRATRGAAPAGAIVVVRGAVTATSRGVRVLGTVEAQRGTSPLRALRGRAAASIDTLFGARAPVARALLVAEQHDIPSALRDRYADAGLVHLLSISGLHVAIVAGALATLASVARVPRRHAHVVALGAVAAYVAVLGAPAPAVRSAVMFATVSLADRWQHPVHPWTALALGALLPTVDVTVVHDLGWQLSVSGMAALVAARAALRRARQSAPTAIERRRPRLGEAGRALRTLSGWRYTLLREVATGIAATLITAPLIAWTFGRVALVAPISNLAAGPIVTVLQPALFLALVLAPMRPAAQFVADATAPLLAALDQVAEWAAAAPLAVLDVAPGLGAAVACGVAMAALVVSTAVRRPVRALVVAACALVVAVWSPALAGGPGRLELHMLDVGQGDALALRLPRGDWVLVDAGPRWDGGDAGRRVVVPYVRRRGGRVAVLVATHAHEDHVGGAASVVRALRPARFWEPAYVGTGGGYADALGALGPARTRWQRVGPGDSLWLDGVLLRVLGPDTARRTAWQDANASSVVLQVHFGAVRLLLTGDAERDEERWLVDRWGDALRADVLKLGHHGSRTSSTPPFLDAVAPRLAIVSVGAGNRYRHPSPDVLEALGQRGIPLMRTDEDGTVVIGTDGRAISVEARGGRWQVP